MIPIKSSAFPNVGETKEGAEFKIASYKHSSIIKWAFQEKLDTVIRLLQDENFKLFSREYLLRRMLKGLNDNINEIHYQKYLEHLCYLERYHEEETRSSKETTLDFIVAFLNAWYLSKSRTISQSGNSTTSTSGKEQTVDLKTHKDGEECERQRIIEHLLSCISNDNQYSHYLKNLCTIE